MKTTSKNKTPLEQSLSGLLRSFNFWLKTRPEFDVSALKQQKCWPVTDSHYKPFTVTKRNGSQRNLVSVDKRLKAMQSTLSSYFDLHFDVSPHAHGFVSSKVKHPFKGSRSELRPKGVVTNALAHTNKKLVISIDIKDFFPTISFPRVMGLLKSEPYNFTNKQAAILASLICLPKSIDEKRGLPQGAPTSPIISNLICKKLDFQLGKMAKRYDIKYTRYADDLTFSTNNIKKISPNEIISKVSSHVERHGFKLNKDKTKVMFSHQKQMVTGILVNEGLNLPKNQVDAIRATLYNLEHIYNSVDDAVLNFWKIGKRSPFNSFVPVGYYPGGYKGRFITSSKGHKANMPISEKEFNSIYAQHLLGRILWYGQVVTTAISTPYELSVRTKISPKQYSRITKYEEMLSAFYRISLKFKWPVQHVTLRQANKLSHLHSQMKLNPIYLLEPIILDEYERDIRDHALKLGGKKEKYTKFFESSPKALQRYLRVQDRSHHNFSFETIKKCVEYGWPDPLKQQKIFKNLNTESLSDLFHNSTDKNGYLVKSLLEDIVRIVRPELRYLSGNVRRKITAVHRELLIVHRADGDSARIDPSNSNDKTERALQAIRDLKTEIRLYSDDSDNFYSRIVQPAVKDSNTTKLVHVDRSDMGPRLVTDIEAWKNTLTKVLISIKQHCSDKEKEEASSGFKPFTIKFRDEDPVSGNPRAIEIYRKDFNIAFKQDLDIDSSVQNGMVKRWKTGADLTSAVNSFISIGNLYVHGKFKDCDDVSFDLTEHFYYVDKNLPINSYGKLFFSIQELKC